MENNSRKASRGALAMLAACGIWGLIPLYYDLLAHVAPTVILAHRTIWSFVFFAIVLLVQGRIGALLTTVSDRRSIGWLVLAASMISVNWFLFIYAVQVGRVTESSLGYYIFPLISVLFGFTIFRERLSAAQWLAVGFAAVAVIVLTLGLGAAPWISLIMATTFAIYGVLKKQVSVGPVVSVTTEVLVLTPIALAWLFYIGGLGASDTQTVFLLAASGPLTAGPLILFSYAAKRVRMATLGVLQYINPSLHFLLALWVFGEPMGTAHAIAFPMIWLGLALYSWSAFAQDRAERRESFSSPTVGTS